MKFAVFVVGLWRQHERTYGMFRSPEPKRPSIDW